jgi:hypothetical protein
MSPGRFFISTLPVGNNNEIVQQYHQHLTSPWFSGQSERENKLRGVRCLATKHTPNIADSLVTASVPLIFKTTGMACYQ